MKVKLVGRTFPPAKALVNPISVTCPKQLVWLFGLAEKFYMIYIIIVLKNFHSTHFIRIH